MRPLPPDTLKLAFEYDERLGFYQWEKKQKQKLLVTIEITLDVKKAAKSDHLDDTIDYDAIDCMIRDLLRGKHFHLIESFAEAVASALLQKWPKSTVTVMVDKPLAIAHAKKISVIISRRGKTAAKRTKPRFPSKFQRG